MDAFYEQTKKLKLFTGKLGSLYGKGFIELEKNLLIELSIKSAHKTKTIEIRLKLLSSTTKDYEDTLIITRWNEKLPAQTSKYKVAKISVQNKI